jgi:tRNA threonylcarbamoyladenosine biosynthesis protein TsaE
MFPASMKEAQVGEPEACVSSSVSETLQLGRELAEKLAPGDWVLLTGPIGAGKTVLAHGIAAGLGASGWEGSPTFTLINEYDTQPPLYHVDLYRLRESEVRELGLEDLICRPPAAGRTGAAGSVIEEIVGGLKEADGAVVVVEWADRAAPYLGRLAGPRAWRVELDHLAGDRRQITLHAPDRR